jgi:hypothetical protein
LIIQNIKNKTISEQDEVVLKNGSNEQQVNSMERNNSTK